MTAASGAIRVAGHAKPLRVLESFQKPRLTTNPYITQLVRSLDNEAGCELVLFSFKRAIFSSYDVFHVHWPEVIYTGNSPVKGLARELLTAAILVRLWLSRKALVRTRHNVEPHSGMTLRQKLLNAWFDRLTAVNIRLNDVTVAPSPVVTILHGHYRDWFAAFPRRKRTVGRIAFFGLIRQYKGVENLIAAFLELHDPALSLSVSGRPTDAALRGTLIKLAGSHPDIEFNFKFLSDAELVEAVTQSELVVLPYNFMHNSGAALTALSLGRPVLVPATEINRRLGDEVGPGWVYYFEGQINADDIGSTLGKHRLHPPQQEPDLHSRSWENAGADHLRVFADACRLRKRTGVEAGSLLVTQPESVGGRDE